ncbi:hypothetical protein PUR57_02450 [Streptomyces sp. JV176]|nr:hypothetical protein [Streptomyces sp. JV176]MEE1797555.1 hypothetical protein [Streptomyces sp. JV176]
MKRDRAWIYLVVEVCHLVNRHYDVDVVAFVVDSLPMMTWE